MEELCGISTSTQKNAQRVVEEVVPDLCSGIARAHDLALFFVGGATQTVYEVVVFAICIVVCYSVYSPLRGV